MLKHPLYRRYMLGNSLSLLGLWVHRVGLGWLTWELTGSGFWLGAVAFADLFPAIVVGPFAGVWADRVDRIRLLRWSQATAAALSLVLFALVIAGAASIYVLITIAVCLGVSASIAQPARLALIPSLVDPVEMSSAVALGSAVFNTARFVGPMIAGAIIAFWDVSYAFLFNGVTFMVMVGALLTIPLGLQEIKAATESHILQEIAEGFRYTLNHHAIRVIMFFILSVAVLGKPIAELLPGFADAVFNRGAIGLALMTQAMGVGALTGGVVLARLRIVDHLSKVALTGFMTSGVLIGAFGLVSNFYVGLAVLFFLSMAISVTGICTQSLVQLAVREDMRGRVMSTWGLIFRGAPSLGVLVMGAAADFSSLSSVAQGAGVVCLIAGLYGYAQRSALKPV